MSNQSVGVQHKSHMPKSNSSSLSQKLSWLPSSWGSLIRDWSTSLPFGQWLIFTCGAGSKGPHIYTAPWVCPLTLGSDSWPDMSLKQQHICSFLQPPQTFLTSQPFTPFGGELVAGSKGCLSCQGSRQPGLRKEVELPASPVCPPTNQSGIWGQGQQSQHCYWAGYWGFHTSPLWNIPVLRNALPQLYPMLSCLLLPRPLPDANVDHFCNALATAFITTLLPSNM